MALRVRKDGRILCAAMHPEEPGDTYIDDNLHYEMSAKHGVLVAEPMHLHELSGQWWWAESVPDGVIVCDWRRDHRNASRASDRERLRAFEEAIRDRSEPKP